MPGALTPLVARPPSPASGVPVEALRGQRVDQVYIGNCANGTMTDLRQAAALLRGRRIAPEVRMVVVPATQKIWRQAPAEGLLDFFAETGAAVSTPTCGACFGGRRGILAAGETAVATTNRNYRGRMGHPESQVFLANAWMAAALREGEAARIALEEMTIAQGGRCWRAQPHGAEVRAILAAGGLVARVRRALAEEKQAFFFGKKNQKLFSVGGRRWRRGVQN